MSIDLPYKVRIRPAPQAVAIERGSTRSGCGGLWLLSCFPVPWKKVDDFIGWMIGQPRQNVGKPGLRIDVVHLAGLCRPPNYAERVRFPQDSS